MSNSILFQDLVDRDTMLDNVFKSNPEYLKQENIVLKMFEELRDKAPNKEYFSLVFKFESATGFLSAKAQDLSYEKGFQDGVKFIFDCLSKDKSWEPIKDREV